MRSVSKQQAAERLYIFRIAKGQLDRFHSKPVILMQHDAIQQPVLSEVLKR
jgi:hypothetical protein